MDKMILGFFAVLCFYVGYVYLFNRDLAVHWENSRRRTLGQTALVRNDAWRGRATRRGISAIAVGLLFVAILAGVL